MLNYEPDQKPEMTPRALARAIKLHLTPVNIICNEPDAKVGDSTGVSFIAYVDYVPRIGERIVLQDETTCEVRMVYHKVVLEPETQMISAMINIAAVRLGGNR